MFQAAKRAFANLASREGQKVPSVTFKARKGLEWKHITSDQIFTGKRVVLFALPGAYTPTCSSTHLPRYSELSNTLKANGVDEVVCLSVNDGFVMESWGIDQQAEGVTLIPDGNGEFSEGMGMLVDKSDIGFGKRSWRYSMVVQDGVIEKMFIEPQKPGDPFEVSDADHMLQYINPDAKAPDSVLLFTRSGCPHCARAKDLLKKKGHAFQEVKVGEHITLSGVRAVSGKLTVPQVFINGKHIGGADDLEKVI